MQASLTNFAAHRLAARVGYGATQREIEAIRSRGYDAWIDSQLVVPTHDDARVVQKLEQAKLRIRYPANPAQEIEAVDEERPLTTIAEPVDTTWHRLDGGQKVANQERVRPRAEVAAATLYRWILSPSQLYERMVGFWHDHFSVYALEGPVAVALPSYDRDTIRPNALGNFRTLLGAVARSTAMLAYLNNRSSRAGSANENYARELFELHTLGADAYLNAVYDHWRAVPGALQGKPNGYIDQDVYEAARAFTGWTIEDGATIAGGRKLPVSGRFAYVDSFHDGYQKRVLAREFDPFRGAMRDGDDVLDLVATHPATARHVVGKLVRRFVADDPPPALIERAAKIFAANRTAPDQIARTVRAIVTSPECIQSVGAKVRRPAELVAAVARSAGLDLTVTDQLLGTIDSSGHRLFGCSPPTGFADDASTWLGTQAMRQRWLLTLGLFENYWTTGKVEMAALTLDGRTNNEALLAAWQVRLLGAADPGQAKAIMEATKLDPSAAATEPRLRKLVAYVAMSPAFQSV